MLIKLQDLKTYVLNTSGISKLSEKSQYDMVRSGNWHLRFGNEASEDWKINPRATLKTIITTDAQIEPMISVGLQ